MDIAAFEEPNALVVHVAAGPAEQAAFAQDAGHAVILRREGVRAQAKRFAEAQHRRLSEFGRHSDRRRRDGAATAGEKAARATVKQGMRRMGHAVALGIPIRQALRRTPSARNRRSVRPKGPILSPHRDGICVVDADGAHRLRAREGFDRRRGRNIG